MNALNDITRTGGDAQSTYVLGESEAETRRLIRQGRSHNPFTRRLLEEAGLSEGMRVLDVGSGAGDVALIAAELVGEEGSVLGVDRNPGALAVARRRASEAGLANAAFLEGDLGAAELGEGFDAVVGRFVLQHHPEPVPALRSLAGRVRPGGIVAFQEMNLRAESLQLCPPTPLWERYWGWSRALFRFGGEAEMGYKLYRAFLAAGLPEPRMRLEASVGGGLGWCGYEDAAETLRSLLPLMVKLGIATEEEVSIYTLAERLRGETVAADGVVKAPEVVGAWARRL
jgi:ubiquinone/menaquinone biosynthesis C-methylase UbiE